MANKTYYFSGKAKFGPRLIKPDLEYRCWNVVLYLDDKSLEQFRKLKDGADGIEGIMNELKQDEDGFYATFKRPMSRTYNGKEQAFTPPVVIGADNMPWQDHRLIGIGSDLTVKCEWYSFNKPFKKNTKGSAIRLVSARVDNLVEYTPQKDYSEEEVKMVKGLPEQPKQYF